jgi:hypothetical protein
VKFGKKIISVLNTVSKTIKNMAKVQVFDDISVTTRRIQNAKVKKPHMETLCISVWITPFQSGFFHDTNFIICTKKNTFK